MRRIVLTALVPVVLSACAPKAEVDELNARVEALEKRVKDIEDRPAAPAGAAPAANAAEEQAAGELYQQVNNLMGENKIPEARAALDELMTKYGKTRTGMRASRLKQELDVFGKSVTTPPVEKWFVGGASDMDLASGTTLLVFWEEWCPHCKREVPKIQETADKYKGRMDVIGLTKVTKSATEEKVAAFIADQKLTYPIAKETGAASELFAVSGIPAAAVVKDGVVVWRGHPARLTDEMINGWL